MSDHKPDTEEYNEEETQRRMDAAIKRALNTPPKPHSEMAGKRQAALRHVTSRKSKAKA